MISERDIWAAAQLMVKRYKADAMAETAARADQLVEDGDMLGAATWPARISSKDNLVKHQVSELPS